MSSQVSGRRLRPDVVVGLGNEIARDDGVGILVAKELERRLGGRGADVVALPWAGFALLDVLAGRRRAVLVDCLVSGRHPPGTVVRLTADDFRGSVRLNSFHDVDLPTVLALGRRLGVCSEAHHLASAKACDAVYGVEIPPAARKLRELLYSAFYVGDHATHFYVLGGPDFVMGPDFAQFTVKIVDDVVLANDAYVDMIRSDTFTHPFHSMGTVDENDHVSFYDGRVRVVDCNGNEIAKYRAADYLEHVAEHVEPWSYLKFPYLKRKGWQGFTAGNASGVYRASPLSRLNAADGMATPLAQAEYERYYETLTTDASGKTPVHQTLATHWARVVEMVYAAERTLELAEDEEILPGEIRVVPTATPREGVGSVEAPRGTLTHHYVTDERGILERVNLIVGTTNNHAAICMSIKKAAKGLIRQGVEITEGLLNKIEMAFRAYDPCFACATHSLPGGMPMTVRLRDADGTVLDEKGRD